MAAPGSNEATQPRTPTILVVDDEANLRDTIAYNLKREGFAVLLAADGLDGLRQARDAAPSAIVLDVMLPGLDGLEVCRAIRAESNVPILLLSARGEEIDRVVGLEIGADDYLTKPFAMRELLARVRAMLRRARMSEPVLAGTVARAARPDDGRIVVGPVEIDVPRRRVALNGAPIALKPKEFELLLYLARRPGIAVSRDALLREVWEYNFPMDTRTVDVHVRWLRQKLEADPANPVLIETVRGYGYRLEPGVG